MNEILDNLYEIAAEASPRWLFDDKALREYEHAKFQALLLENHLRETVGEENFKVYEECAEAMNEKEHLERRMIFSRALSIGLSLGMLGK